MTTQDTMSRRISPRDLKQVIARELAAFEQRENAMKASERRDRAEALGLPLSLAATASHASTLAQPQGSA